MVAGGTHIVEQQGSACPATLQIVGRPSSMENGDICGEYIYAGSHGGRAAYRKRGATMAIRYAASCRRWVIDREGLRESDVCVAFADEEAQEHLHPATPELVWHIWDPRCQAHMVDAEVASLDAPATLSLIGRTPGRSNHSVVGEYDLAAVHHGRPAYRQRGGDVVLRYLAPEQRWLLAAANSSGTVCYAFAAGAAAQHPASADLVWTFWEAERSSWVPDPAVKTMSCPAVLHIIGREGHKESARIVGTYRLAGAHEGRPLYVQPNTQKVIRYSSRTGNWLIDCEGLAEPSLLSRLYQWILTGDGASAADRCCAMAAGRHAPHPGSCALEWSVWETRLGRHVPDAAVRATTAPLAVQVCGRDPSRENGDIVGSYILAGTFGGRPAYVNSSRIGSSGQPMAIRYCAPYSRWIIDREGLRHSNDHVVAFVDNEDDAEHPACSGVWHVFESSRNAHLADPAVVATIAADAPSDIPCPTAPNEQLAAQKRAIQDFGGLGDAKRPRVAGDRASWDAAAAAPGAAPSMAARFATLGA